MAEMQQGAEDWAEQVVADLKSDEGFRASAYHDSEDFLTIGYGTLIDERKNAGLTKPEAEGLLRNRLRPAIRALYYRFDWFDGLSPARKRALANMSYQLGMPTLLQFRMMLAAFEAGDIEAAAEEALASRWAEQTPTRAQRMAKLIREG